MASTLRSRDSQEDNSSPIQLQDIYYLILERWWVLAASVGLLLVLAGIYILISPRLYTSKTVMEVAQTEDKVMNFQDVSQQDLGSQDVLKTIEQNFASSAVFEGMVLRNKLTQDQAFLETVDLDNPTDSSVARALSGRASAVLRKGTRLIDVGFDNGNPQMAQKLAGMYMAEVIRQRILQRTNASAMATQFLVEEAEKQKARLKESEIALQEYQEQFGTVSLMERQDTVTQKLKELNMSLTEVNAERIRLESQMDEAKRNKDNPQSLLTLAAGMNDPAAQDLRNRISEQESLLGALVQRYKEKHPKMIQARSQLKELNESLKRVASPERLQYAYESSVAKEKSFEAALKLQEQEALDLNRRAIDYKALLRDVDSNRAIYESVSKRLQETSMAQGIESSDLSINQVPTLPGSPSKPQKTLILAAALFAGTLLGLTIVFILHLLNDTFKTVDQVEAALDIPVLGALPLEEEADESQGGKSQGLFVDTHPDSPLTEGFRSLRASLALLGREEDRKTFLLTSAVPEEGKSFVCSNLATMFAQQNLKTLVIDADLRKPRLTSIFGLTDNDMGLSSYFTSREKLEKLVVKTSVANLWILPAGKRLPNPSELLSGTTFSDLIQEASKSYDRVVVDTAPIHAVSDTLLIAEFVQSVCLVIRAGKTPRNAVLRAIEMIKRSKVIPVGAILNRLPRNRGMGYYYYYSHYEGYGDQAYGAQSAKPRGKK